MPRYKRTYDEAGLAASVEPDLSPENVEIRDKLRNMWEFASLMQYIFLFGDVVKIDKDLDIEDLEVECLMPKPSQKLAEIGLALLKFVSSHRGLDLNIFSEFTRRQYFAKAPQRNPFGDGEDPTEFNDLDIFTRVRILHQLSTWTLHNPDRIRGLMTEKEDDLDWRMEPLGWDKQDRSYFLLDDNRLYRRVDEVPPPPSPKVKAKSKSTPRRKSRGTRASKRLKIEDSSEDEAQDVVPDANGDSDVSMQGVDVDDEDEAGFGFTSKTWKCIAVTMDDYQEFMSTIFRSRDPNEKQLHARLEADVMPVISQRVALVKQRQIKKMRELETEQKMATAKRSSRLADKADKEKQERDEREAAERRQRDLDMALAEQEKQKRIEEGHESRRLTREQRLRERESKRILHEEELARLEEDAKRMDAEEDSEGAPENSKRMSSRQLLTQKAQHKLELEKLAEDQCLWVFDCAVCGVYGENLDDGTHSIACDKCSVWQHSKCHGLTEKEAEREDFSFVCSSCKQKEEDATKPKITPLKLAKTQDAENGGHMQPADALPDYVRRQLDGVYIPPYHGSPPERPSGPFAGPLPVANGISPHPQQPSPGANGAYSQQLHFQGSPGMFTPSAHQRSPAALHIKSERSPNPTAGGRPDMQQMQGNMGPSPQRLNHQTWHESLRAGPQQPHSPQPPSWHAGGPAKPLSMSPEGRAGFAPSAPNVYGAPSQSPPPANTQHYQQHNHAHQSALQTAPGQPAHLPPYGSQPNLSPYGHAPQPHLPQLAPPLQPPNDSRTAFSQPKQPTSKPGKGPGPTKLLNDFTSPKKRVPQKQGGASASPPPATSVHSADTRATSIAAEKASPPRATTSQDAMRTPNRLRAPFQFTPISYDGKAFDGRAHAAESQSSGSKIAADGMSGPWPDRSNAIPQKHDQSPPAPLLPSQAPPSTSKAQGSESSSGSLADRTGILSPATPLAPSPRQQAAAETGTIPVKRAYGSPLTNANVVSIEKLVSDNEQQPSN